QPRLELERLAAFQPGPGAHRVRGEVRRVARVVAAAGEAAGDAGGLAARPVAEEELPREVDGERAEVDLGAADRARDRIGDDVDLAAFRFDEDGRADDHVAKVERAGDRRGDDHHRERRSLIWTG